mmetsp:Transcript_48317/g.146519  ORF Transcript_48317/g.146519 Transcript_48317/m.146519 type:complete len:354 (+) Transcript_48317:88-1149(+)
MEHFFERVRRRLLPEVPDVEVVVHGVPARDHHLMNLVLRHVRLHHAVFLAVDLDDVDALPRHGGLGARVLRLVKAARRLRGVQHHVQEHHDKLPEALGLDVLAARSLPVALAHEVEGQRPLAREGLGRDVALEAAVHVDVLPPVAVHVVHGHEDAGDGARGQGGMGHRHVGVANVVEHLEAPRRDVAGPHAERHALPLEEVPQGVALAADLLRDQVLEVLAQDLPFAPAEVLDEPVDVGDAAEAAEHRGLVQQLVPGRVLHRRRKLVSRVADGAEGRVLRAGGGAGEVLHPLQNALLLQALDGARVDHPLRAAPLEDERVKLLAVPLEAAVLVRPKLPRLTRERPPAHAAVHR